MKPYVKPDIMFEDFQLTQSVAACRWDMLYQTEIVCVAEYDITMTATRESPSRSGLTLFHDPQIGCRMDERQVQEYCYTNAVPTMKVLAS